jgi:hypothetical protein
MFPTTPPTKKNISYTIEERQRLRAEMKETAIQFSQNVGRFVNQENAISDLLAGPICVGENHSHQAPKQWF